MDPINHQGGFAEAFVLALAAGAALRVAKPFPDLDGIDYNLVPDRIGERGGARFSPIAVQVKSGSDVTETDTSFGYRLDAKHFNLLARQDLFFYPLYLFLVVVPKGWRDYTQQTPDGLLLRYAAYWHSLAGEPQIVDPAPGAKTTVHVSKANLLTVDSLRALVGTPLSLPEAQVEAS